MTHRLFRVACLAFLALVFPVLTGCVSQPETSSLVGQCNYYESGWKTCWHLSGSTLGTPIPPPSSDRPPCKMATVTAKGQIIDFPTNAPCIMESGN